MKKIVSLVLFSLLLISCDDITNVTRLIEPVEEFEISLYRADTSDADSFVYFVGNYEYYLSHYSWAPLWNGSDWRSSIIDSVFKTQDTLWLSYGSFMRTRSSFDAVQIMFYGTQNGIDFVQHTWVKP